MNSSARRSKTLPKSQPLRYLQQTLGDSNCNNTAYRGTGKRYVLTVAFRFYRYDVLISNLCSQGVGYIPIIMSLFRPLSAPWTL